MQQRIDTFVNAIYVYEDKIILTFNDKEGTKTISLDEINGSGLDSIAAPDKRCISYEVQRFLFIPAHERRCNGHTIPKTDCFGRRLCAIV